MEKKSFFSFRRGDFFAIALVLALALAVGCAYLPGGDGHTNGVAQVFLDAGLVKELPLDVDASFELTGEYRNLIVVRDGRVSIEESSCPGGDCMHSAGISRPGRSIVCLPNRVEIRITGQSDVDFVLR